MCVISFWEEEEEDEEGLSLFIPFHSFVRSINHQKNGGGERRKREGERGIKR
jgi:hypothetical protein